MLLIESREHGFQVGRFRNYIDDVRRHVSSSPFHLVNLTSVGGEYLISRRLSAQAIKTPALVVDPQRRKFSADFGLIVDDSVCAGVSEERFNSLRRGEAKDCHNVSSLRPA